MTRHRDCQQQKKKKGNCPTVDFDVPANHRVKLKGSKKRDKNLDFARELKKNYGTWSWRWYQLWSVHLGQSLKN